MKHADRRLNTNFVICNHYIHYVQRLNNTDGKICYIQPVVISIMCPTSPTLKFPTKSSLTANMGEEIRQITTVSCC